MSDGFLPMYLTNSVLWSITLLAFFATRFPGKESDTGNIFGSLFIGFIISSFMTVACIAKFLGYEKSDETPRYIYAIGSGLGIFYFFLGNLFIQFLGYPSVFQ